MKPEKKHKLSARREQIVEEMLTANYSKYYKLAYSYVRNEADAQDIVQEGAYKAILNCDFLKEVSYADTWIYRIMMNEALAFLRKNRKENVSIDDIQESVTDKAKKDKADRKKILVYKRIGTCAAAALAVAILVPNVSVNAAMAMEKIPVLGSLVRVVTFGRYEFEDDRHNADVEIPQIEVEMETVEKDMAEAGTIEKETGSADTQAQTEHSANAINREITDYVTPLLEDFQKNLDADTVKGLDISYDIVTDTDDWFTLRINVLEVQASGYQHYQYYHIDKTTGKQAVLADLFRENADYITAISDNIKAQMREQMASDEGKMYFLDQEDTPEFNFNQIKADQNFYFNENGEIVISFDEYEVAPGYMGAVSFTIPKEVTDPLLIR